MYTTRKSKTYGRGWEEVTGRGSSDRWSRLREG